MKLVEAPRTRIGILKVFSLTVSCVSLGYAATYCKYYTSSAFHITKVIRKGIKSRRYHAIIHTYENMQTLYGASVELFGKKTVSRTL